MSDKAIEAIHKLAGLTEKGHLNEAVIMNGQTAAEDVRWRIFFFFKVSVNG